MQFGLVSFWVGIYFSEFLALFLSVFCTSLARQWTMEDEEEVERERRRKVRGSSSTADPEDEVSLSSSDVPPGNSRPGGHTIHETSQVPSR